MIWPSEGRSVRSAQVVVQVANGEQSQRDLIVVVGMQCQMEDARLRDCKT